MNVSVLIGILAIGYGLSTAVLRVVKPASFAKLEPMRERFGAKLGTAIHVIAYSVVPVGVGVRWLLAGLSGE